MSNTPNEEAEALLNELFEQADQATPSECRDNVFRDVMQSVEDFLIKQKLRVVSQKEFRMRPSQACWDGDVSEQDWMDINKGE